QRGNPVDERDQLVFDRQTDVEDVVGRLVGRAGEHRRRAARALDQRVAVPGRDGRRRRGQQRGERPERQVHLVGGEQGLVVGLRLRGRAVVVEDIELDRAAEQAAAGVHVAGPQLVAALEGLAVGGEVAGQRQRRADQGGLGAGRGRGAARGGGAAAATAAAAGRHDADR